MQGGIEDGSGTKTITFPTAFTRTDYNILIVPRTASDNWGEWTIWGVRYTTATTTKCNVIMDAQWGTVQIGWLAYGY